MDDTTLSMAFGATALLLIGMAIPLVRRRIAPNPLYGFRTAATRGDESLWYEVNARTGWDLLAVGVGVALLTASHLAGLLAEQTWVTIAVAWLVGGALGTLVHGLWIIRRTHRRPPERHHGE